ncbi:MULTISPECIES: type VI secretion system-associated FHA domain protein [unclassified Vibrio]|uniref:type VI secretion system-associated FHA domain protein n=1 Tax=unclassified Vibrio TaxID=2614977 RepID=UPI001360EA48|nr:MULTISPECIES: FHA domain-containing protein [unclassified Vibrio]NAW57730.1 FHA domain-containing protein [Vibrio sp. V36_P2S2PM302]NAX22992.1 FHA domain-containing protein [Vibrio sp. V39_P1S14PM300]NAX28032.1 FHA domain-containing protein [Vibrio sp. V38_P2S17PM301]NAX30215.1 FHA domain-containing protein [Vibrio sp. V37_P2S8PM304]
MPLSIRIISSPDGESIAQWNQAFPEEGGEIGRAFGATLQLSDASREVSGTHAIIRKTSRGYQIADNSTNGLFINGSDEPLGKGNQSTLSDGDVLDIGRYRLLVSCFIPEKAQAQRLTEVPTASQFGDDPFRTELSSMSVEPSEPEDPQFTISDFDVVDDDPFLSDDVTRERQRLGFDLEFQTEEDDPLGEEAYQASLPATAQEPSPFEAQPVQFALTEFRKHEQRLQQQTDKALEMALTRLLADISPQAMESMFDDLSGAGFWSRKPKYWDMYKRYFARQVDNRDWQVKFQAYFHDALRLQRNLEGDKQ